MKKSGVFPLAVLLCFCIMGCKTLPSGDSGEDAGPGFPVERTEPGAVDGAANGIANDTVEDAAALPEDPGAAPEVPEEEDVPEVSVREYPPDYFEEVLAEPASDPVELSFPEAAPEGGTPEAVLPEPALALPPEPAELPPEPPVEPPPGPPTGLSALPAEEPPSGPTTEPSAGPTARPTAEPPA
ncbi:MAG: hypothetical protein LBU21_07000, partial [Treponema sp.]|nr:hypothetical protein [Treponema sp.]